MAQTYKGLFTPKSPSKYMGNADKIIYRSSWELAIMRYFDVHPHVIGWSSESISIPYLNPLTRRQTVYIPDFLVVYEKNGKKYAEMIEIKPYKEIPGTIAEGKGKVTRKDKLAQILNGAKWKAAAMFCAKRQIRFRVLTERDLFYTGKKQ